MRQGIRPDVKVRGILFGFLLLALARILIVRTVGTAGIGILALPMELYLGGWVGFFLAFRRIAGETIRYYARKERYWNAREEMKRLAGVSLLSSAALAVLSVLLCRFLATGFFLDRFGYLSFLPAAPCLIFLALQGVLQGYLDGFGIQRPIYLMQSIQGLLTLLLGVFFARLGAARGARVDALLHIDRAAPAYGAMGAMAGFLLALFLGTVYLLVQLWISLPVIERISEQGAPRYLGESRLMLSEGAPFLLSAFALHGLTMLEEKFYLSLSFAGAANTPDPSAAWGVWYGRVLTPVIFFAVLCCLPCVRSCYQVCARVRRGKTKAARMEFSVLFRQAFLLLLPAAIFAAVLSGTLEALLFGLQTEEATGLLSAGSVCIPLTALSVLLGGLLILLRSGTLFAGNLAAACTVRVVLSFFFSMRAEGERSVLVYALAVMLGVFVLLSLAEFFMMLRFRPVWLRDVFLPCACAAVSGLVLYFLQSPLTDQIGEALTACLLVVLGGALYFAGLLFLGCVGRREISAWLGR